MQKLTLAAAAALFLGSQCLVVQSASAAPTAMSNGTAMHGDAGITTVAHKKMKKKKMMMNENSNMNSGRSSGMSGSPMKGGKADGPTNSDTMKGQ